MKRNIFCAFLCTIALVLIFGRSKSQNPTLHYSAGSGYIATLGGDRVSPYHKEAWWLFDSLIQMAETIKDTSFAEEVFKTKFQLTSMRTDTTDSLTIDVLLWHHYVPTAGSIEQFNVMLQSCSISSRIIKNYMNLAQPNIVLFDGAPFTPQKYWNEYFKRQKPIQYNQNQWTVQYPGSLMEDLDLPNALIKQGIVNPEKMYGMEDTTILQQQLNLIYSDSLNEKYSRWIVSYRSLKALTYAYSLYKQKKDD